MGCIIPYSRTATDFEKARCIFKWIKSGRVKISDLNIFDEMLLKRFYGNAK